MRRVGFTLVEVLVTLAILAVLAALIFPVLASSRRRADDAVCISNLRQIGQAFSMYLEDYRDRPPRLDHLAPVYVSSRELYICPADPYVERGGWAWDYWGKDYTPFEAQPFAVSYGYFWYRIPNLDRDRWTWAEALPDAGYACCVVHGEVPVNRLNKIQASGLMAPPYWGKVYRLGFDGRVFTAHNDFGPRLFDVGIALCGQAFPAR